MNVAHLTASPFFGGPERQMTTLAHYLPSEYRSSYFTFREGGQGENFARVARERGCSAEVIQADTPNLPAMCRELVTRLRAVSADVLCCHGYKANLVGRMATWWLGIPCVAVSRGWTAENKTVARYEALDRRVLRWMTRVVAVSEGQAVKVRAAGVRDERLLVIRNSIQPQRFDAPDPAAGDELRALFNFKPMRIVGAAGRLSPEKGFDVLVEAAAKLLARHPTWGFVHFGDGTLRPDMERRIAELGLTGRFVLGGFRKDLDRFFAHFDLFVLPSYTEGLPNVVLESLSAGVPVVATAVGGTPEVLDDERSGYLVQAGDPDALATRIQDALESEIRRLEMGRFGRARVARDFSFDAQASAYRALFEELTAHGTVTAGQSA